MVHEAKAPPGGTFTSSSSGGKKVGTQFGKPGGSRGGRKA